MKTIIMAGGSGTRLWPLSRTHYPKQFLKLKGMDKSIFQMTMERCLKMTALSDIYIVTNADYRFLIAGQIEELGLSSIEENILLEPVARNTLPAIYNGVKHIQKKGDDVVAVFASDHLINDSEAFIRQIRSVERLSFTNLITFGVKPQSPETGYGYIKPGAAIENAFAVDEFKEKPDLETAESYVASGYFWNSGMFMFRTDLFAEEVKKYAPEVFAAFETGDTDAAFEKSPSISIDYGVMERSDKVAVLPLTIEWNDLGSFATFYDEYNAHKDEDGNVLFGDAIAIDSRDALAYTDRNKAVALVGVSDLVVVDQKDALLICHKNRTQAVKQVVDTLRQREDRRADYHLTEYRPWGSFTILEEGDFYKIKRLTVLPGKRLSVQMHYHRSEHWIAVSGTGIIVRDGEEIMFTAGENVFVPQGSRHRLINPGKLLLQVIEVQSGAYLGEDDIVRFADEFGRV